MRTVTLARRRAPAGAAPRRQPRLRVERAAAPLLLLLAACADRLPGPPAVAHLRVQPDSAAVFVSGTRQFRAVAFDASDDSIPGVAVAWSSSEPGIADVSASGLATGHVPGVARVTATVGVRSSSAQLTVRPPPAVATVAVQPESAAVPLQGSWPFTATGLDSAGDTVPVTAFTWSSGDTALASVDAAGLATGKAPGAVTIEAAAPNGRRGTGTLTVLQPGTGPWPNEPPGLTVLSDQPWSVLTLLGWLTQFGAVTIGVDLSAPLSPPSVLTETYPVGYQGGAAPGTETFNTPGLSAIYVGQWWKVSDPWQGHDSNVNKVQFVFFTDGSDIPMVMYGVPGGPYELRCIPQFRGQTPVWLTPNVNQVPVTLGTWHRIEWLLVENTQANPPNGIVRWWLDGQLIGDYTGLLFPAPIGALKISPTWGGVGDVKTETDYFWYDHTHLSGR